MRVSIMASIVRLTFLSCRTCGHLVLQLRKCDVLQQFKWQLLLSDSLCCDSGFRVCKPMHLNMCYMRYACVRPVKGCLAIYWTDLVNGIVCQFFTSTERKCVSMTA